MVLAQGQVVVLAPGLQGPRLAHERPAAQALSALLAGLELPSLSRVLQHGAAIHGAPGQHLEEMFARLVGLARGELGGWPMAALSRHAAHDDAREGSWLRADPVHLRPDLSKLRVFDGASLQLDMEEAQQLCAHLNDSGDLGVAVEADSETRWFMHLDAVPRVHGVSPARAHGEDAAAHMLAGPDAALWRQRMNLAQMLLHSAPANQRREALGRPAANSLWFWGAGVLPAQQALLDGVQVWSQHSWARGAAAFLGGSAHPLPARAQGLEPAAPRAAQLLLLEDFLHCTQQADPLAWRNQLCEFDRDWLQPLLAALDEGRIRSLQVHAGDGIGLALGRRLPWRWWSASGWRRPALPELLQRRLHRAAPDAGDGAP